MKTITLWLTSRANESPGLKGHTVHVVDPSPGIELERRTLASGFGVPIPVQVPDKAIITQSEYDEDFLWIGETAMALQYHRNRGLVTAWPAMIRPPAFKDRLIFQSVKGFAVPFC